MVGPVGYEREYHSELRALAGADVVFTGGQYGDQYQVLSRHALAFIMPATIEATRLVLLDQMGFGSAIVYRECPASREVVGEAGLAFGGQDPVLELEAMLDRILENPGMLEYYRQGARERARDCFDWNQVTDVYVRILNELIQSPESKTRQALARK
ncbi:MAG: glycosyltransferase [Blastochloris sp.]|nr:glycosyltransferase [Blastochloris sp.]